MSDHHGRALRRLSVTIVFVVGTVTGMLLIVGVGLGDAVPGIEDRTSTGTTTTSREVEFQPVAPCGELVKFLVTNVDDIPVCVDEQGTRRYSPSAVVRCVDGRVLWWSDVAWGYLDRLAQPVPDGPFLMPEEVWNKCMGQGENE